jgi:hypothetical protein
MGRTDFNFTLKEKDSIGLQRKLFKTIEASLRKPPLEMETFSESNKIVGTKDYSYVSEIDRFTRQTVIVESSGQEVADLTNGKIAYFYPIFSVSTTLYVSKRNSSEANDWKLPSNLDEQIYIKLIRTAIWQATNSFCSGAKVKKVNLNRYEVSCAP